MTCTLSLHGRVIGETDLDYAGAGPRQRVAIFRPTTQGLRELPRISGLMSAGLALKRALARKGLDPESMDADAVMEFLDRAPEGRRIIDIAKALEALELRDERGARLLFTSIAVSDLDELARLGQALEEDTSLPDCSAEERAAHRYLISATLTSDSAARLPAPKPADDITSWGRT